MWTPQNPPASSKLLLFYGYSYNQSSQVKVCLCPDVEALNPGLQLQSPIMSASKLLLIHLWESYLNSSFSSPSLIFIINDVILKPLMSQVWQKTSVWWKNCKHLARRTWRKKNYLVRYHLTRCSGTIRHDLVLHICTAPYWGGATLSI